MNWTDGTTYSRDDKERKQTAWELSTDYVRIYITNKHLWFPNKWVIICNDVGISSASEMKIPFESTPEQAQEMAIKIVKHRLKKMFDSLLIKTK